MVESRSEGKPIPPDVGAADSCCNYNFLIWSSSEAKTGDKTGDLRWAVRDDHDGEEAGTCLSKSYIHTISRPNNTKKEPFLLAKFMLWRSGKVDALLNYLSQHCQVRLIVCDFGVPAYVR